jgi:hypothetical protein
LAISTGRPNRPKGVCEIANGFSSADPAIAKPSVSVAQGSTAFTRVFLGPSSGRQALRDRVELLCQQLLWKEYRQGQRGWLSLRRFCERYHRCRRKQGVVLRLGTQGRRKAVRRLRTTTPIYNPSGGPVKQAHLFVAALDISRAILLHRP